MKAEQKTIYCMGSIIMDISVRCPHFPGIGETAYTSSPYELAPGGKGGNQAVAVARMGGKVKMLGRMSTDEYGQSLAAHLKKDGVDTTHVIWDDSEKSGVAFVWVDPEGRNQIICSPAVNLKNRFQDYERILQSITPGDIVILTLEMSGELITRTAELVKEKGGFLILDPSGGNDSCLTPELLSLIDMVKPNEIEAEFLTGIKITDQASMERAIEVLEQKGITYPLISLGENGVIYKNKERIRHIPGIPVRAVDTTAAGDTFLGAFSSKLSQGCSIEEAVEYGNRAASVCVQRSGAQASIPYAGDLQG